jgi:hypothetical protein
MVCRFDGGLDSVEGALLGHSEFVAALGMMLVQSAGMPLQT